MSPICLPRSLPKSPTSFCTCSTCREWKQSVYRWTILEDLHFHKILWVLNVSQMLLTLLPVCPGCFSGRNHIEPKQRKLMVPRTRIITALQLEETLLETLASLGNNAVVTG